MALSLPRPRISPQALGGLIAAIALGGAFLALALRAAEQRPGFYFYVFSVIALASALRVISHPKPVYAALYFIGTILSSSALYLMLEAEFLAFALVIIYAGAILITYLFVIMLAQQSPTEQEIGALEEYDRFSREPAVAAAVGFVLLAMLSVMLARGMTALAPAEPRARGFALVERMPIKVIDALDRRGALAPRGGLVRPAPADLAGRLDLARRTARLTVADGVKFRDSLRNPRVAELLAPEDPDTDYSAALPTALTGQDVRLRLPPELRAENIDGVGFTLIAEHPMALELAGVVLLMAMLGAVVLARKQMEISEAEKAAAVLGAPRDAEGESSNPRVGAS